MENKQSINTVFGLLVIIFLAVVILVGNHTNSQKAQNQSDENQITLSYLLQRRNAKIKVLSAQLAEKQKETDGIKKELIDAKNALDVANKKMAAAAAVLDIPTTTPVTPKK